MSRHPWVVAGVAVGAASTIVILLSPVTGAAPTGQPIVSAVLPLGFYAAGAVAAVILPEHGVGHRLLALGALHLASFALLVVSLLLEESALAVAILLPASLAFALGFAVLFDILVRYPTGRVAREPLRSVTLSLYVAAGLLAVLGFFGSPTWPAIGGSESARPNPLHLPALEAVAPIGGFLPALALVGLVLMIVRYRGAPASERGQMRWPIGATVALVA